MSDCMATLELSDDKIIHSVLSGVSELRLGTS